jgi:hypothetical protein
MIIESAMPTFDNENGDPIDADGNVIHLTSDGAKLGEITGLIFRWPPPACRVIGSAGATRESRCETTAPGSVRRSPVLGAKVGTTPVAELETFARSTLTNAGVAVGGTPYT